MYLANKLYINSNLVLCSTKITWNFQKTLISKILSYFKNKIFEYFWEMALLKYGFVLKSWTNVNPPSVADLPDPSGILSKSIPSSTIKASNTAVWDVSIATDSQNEAPDAKQGRYQHYSNKERAEIAKRAIDFGITATICHYASLYPTRGTIPVSSVATWKAKYLKELKIRVQENKQDLVIDKLPNKKRGRPLLLGKELDDYMVLYVKHLCSSGAVVNTAIVMAAATGIVQFMTAIFCQ